MTTAAIVSRPELIALRRRWRRQGKKVVFTNGCFEILHRGHVEYLREAGNLGDVLVVGLNGDVSVRALKGPGRPLVSQEDRAALLAEMRSVSHVCIFEEVSVESLVADLLPDILVKGGDYRIEEIVGRRQVEESGGSVRALSMRPGCSTSTLIEKAKETGV